MHLPRPPLTPLKHARDNRLLLPSAQTQAMGFLMKLSPEPKPTRDDPIGCGVRP